MEFSLNLGSMAHLAVTTTIPIDSISLETKTFSRVGQIEDSDLEHCLDRLSVAGKAVDLVWDLILTDTELERPAAVLAKIADRLAGIRFLDPGVGYFLKSFFPRTRLHYLMLHGQHNRLAINRWVDCFQPQLRGITLSNQIPLSSLRQVAVPANTEIEIQGSGRQVWCYSSRKLIEACRTQQGDLPSELEAASQDRPHQFLRLAENQHGSLVFGDKDLFLLDQLSSLETAGVKRVALNLETEAQYASLQKHFPHPGWENRLKECGRKPTSPGFFHQNTTRQPFVFLTNSYLHSLRFQRIGIVLEAVKSSHLLISIDKAVGLPLDVHWATPEGKSLHQRLSWLQDLKGNAHRSTVTAGLYLTDWIPGIVPGTLMQPPIPTPQTLSENGQP